MAPHHASTAKDAAGCTASEHHALALTLCCRRCDEHNALMLAVSWLHLSVPSIMPEIKSFELSERAERKEKRANEHKVYCFTWRVGDKTAAFSARQL